MKRAIFGYGGHANEVALQIGGEIDFFVDDRYSDDVAKPISTFNHKTHEIMIAVSDNTLRYNAVNRLPKDTKFFTFIHPTALLLDSNIEVGEGSFIGAYSILTTNIKIGKHAILNRGNQIGHDVIIGDYFSAMPGSVVSGNVEIGDFVYIGTNSSIKEKLKVCPRVTIGLNSGVVKNINEYGVYGGTPAIKLK